MRDFEDKNYDEDRNRSSTKMVKERKLATVVGKMMDSDDENSGGGMIN